VGAQTHTIRKNVINGITREIKVLDFDDISFFFKKKKLFAIRTLIDNRTPNGSQRPLIE
jgi:hypothetical protein